MLNMRYNQDGTDKRTLEADRAHHRIVNPIQRSQMSACKRYTRSSQRNIMDHAHRRSPEGFTPTVSAKPDLPQAAPAMGAARCRGLSISCDTTWSSDVLTPCPGL
jgi:hypothetical protein